MNMNSILKLTRDCDEYGFLFRRELEDGRIMGVMPLVMGNAQLCIGWPAGHPNQDPDMPSWDDVWQYANMAEANADLEDFHPDVMADPRGRWIRHPRSGRRRENGDPNKETVRP